MAKIDEAAALINLAKRPIAMIGQGVILAVPKKSCWISLRGAECRFYSGSVPADWTAS